MVNMEYYRLEPRVKNGTAFAIPNGAVSTVSSAPFTEQLKQMKILPYPLELVDLVDKGGIWQPTNDMSKITEMWVDYQPNEWAFPLMSERLTRIVQEHLLGGEGLDWIKAIVTAQGESRNYFIPRFSRLFDIWDKERTIYSVNGDFIVNPCFLKERVWDKAIFYSRPEFWEITSSLVVNEHLMKAIKKAKLTGVSFSPARSS